MLGAQIGKVPVSVGNGSDRIETSTHLSIGYEPCSCLVEEASSWKTGFILTSKVSSENGPRTPCTCA